MILHHSAEGTPHANEICELVISLVARIEALELFVAAHAEREERLDERIDDHLEHHLEEHLEHLEEEHREPEPETEPEPESEVEVVNE